MIAPAGPIYQAGTLSGNPLAMAAGYTTLKLLTPETYQRLEALSARLQRGFEENAERHGIPTTINRVGSMLCPFFTDKIAEIVGCRVATVKTRMFYARRRMKTLLGDAGAEAL